MTGRWFGRAIAIATVLAIQAQPVFAYLEFGVTAGGNQVKLRWPQAAVRYLVTNAGVPNVSVADFQGALDDRVGIPRLWPGEYRLQVWQQGFADLPGGGVP